MSIAPTREETAHGAGYTEASDFYGKMLDNLVKRLTEREDRIAQLRKMLEETRYWIVKSGVANPSAITNQIDHVLTRSE